MKSSCYLVFNYSVFLFPNLYSVNLHNSLIMRSVLVLVLSTAKPSWTLIGCQVDSCYRAVTQTAQKTQFYCCVAQTTQKTSHMIAIRQSIWRAECCLATSCKHSSYCCVPLSLGVYRAVAWQCVNMQQYNTIYILLYLIVSVGFLRTLSVAELHKV
jgi:hypothetical protein